MTSRQASPHLGPVASGVPGIQARPMTATDPSMVGAAASNRAFLPHLFPRLVPDELVFSGVARFLKASSLPAAALITPIGFPSRSWNSVNTTNIAAFCDRLLAGVLTADHVLERHTLLPYHSFTCTGVRVQEIRNVLLHGSANGNAAFSFVHGRRSPRFLRCCPKCVARDEATLGMGAWYRLHQLPGMEMCSEHDAALVISDLRAATLRNRFASASAAGRPPVERILPEATARFVVREYAWLLRHPTEHGRADDLPQRVKALLREHGRLRADGRVDSAKLISEIRSRVGGRLREQAGFDLLREVGFCWVNAARRPPALAYLLLLDILGETVERLQRALPGPVADAMEGRDPPWRRAEPVSAGVAESDRRFSRLDEAREWLRRTLRASPGLGRRELKSLSSGHYTVLLCFDPSLLPKSRSGGSGVDWDARDGEWAEFAVGVARELRERPGKPTKITPSLLRRSLPAHCKSPGDRLPLTAAAIEKLSDNSESYGRRVLAHLAERAGGAVAPLPWAAFTEAVHRFRRCYPSLRREADLLVAEIARRRR